MNKIILPFAILLLAVTSCSNDDSNNTLDPEELQYNILLTAEPKTNICDISINSYAVKIEYLSGSEIISADEWSGTAQEDISGNATLSGDIVGVRVRLTNFNINDPDSGRGTGLENIHLKITDAGTNEVLLDQNRNEYLVICTDAYYEVLYLYDKTTGILTPTVQSHGF